MTKTVLITGGNKGIGRACAERFAAEGHHVLVTGRDEAALQAVADEVAGVEPLAFDVTDEQAWAALAYDVDILVPNAGVAESAPLHRTSLETWNRVLEVNVTGVFLASRAVLPGMRERGWGRIVAVASVASHHGIRYSSAYTASKHAVLGLMRAISMEVAGTQITANSVCPAFVETEMSQRSVDNIVAATGRAPDEAKAVLEGMQPLGRLITVEEVADAVAYLASDGARTINGQSLILDGGGIQK